MSLRLPSVMLDNLRRIAAADGRSTSSTAVRMIAAGIADRITDLNSEEGAA